MTDFFIGIDSGTQSTKAIVMDGDTGLVIGKSTRNYDLISGLPSNYKEQHPEIWISETVAAVKEALNSSKINVNNVKGMGVSGQQHGFVPLDKSGNVIRPAKLWNDTSTTEECNIIMQRVGGFEETIKLVGNPVLPGYTASKILWLKRNEPENFDKLATVLLPHDYINYILTGISVMEYGDASGTILMDIKSRSWCNKIIHAIDSDLREKLPPLHSSGEAVGYLNSKSAKKLGLSTDVLVSAGGGDNMMAAIGTGNTSPGKVTVSLGTSGTIYAYSKNPIIDPLGEVAAFCDSTNNWLPMICTMNVTVATELCCKLFKINHIDLEHKLQAAQAGSSGLFFLPYLTGERTPNMPDSSGVYYGLKPKNFTESNILRATVEGATLGLNYGLNRMRELGIDPYEIRLTGGGSKNQSWVKICADIFDSEVVTFRESEGAALGAAIQALWCYGRHIGPGEPIAKITERLVKLDESNRINPNQKNVKKYINLQKSHDRLRDKLFLS